MDYDVLRLEAMKLARGIEEPSLGFPTVEEVIKAAEVIFKFLTKDDGEDR